MKFQLISLIDGKGAGIIESQNIEKANKKCLDMKFNMIDDYKLIPFKAKIKPTIININDVLTS